MRRPFAVVTVVAMSCVALASEAIAQERKGFWFDVGFGVGSAGVSSDEAEGSRGAVGIGTFKLGWALNPQLLLGMDFRLMTLDVTGDVVGTLDAYNVEAVVVYYPRVSSGLFILGGVGGSFLDLNIEEQGSTLTSNVAKGIGLSAGVGYDFYLGRGFSLTPAATFWYGHTGDVTFRGGTLASDWSHNAVDATVSIKFN